jgi:hypothetical protein
MTFRFPAALSLVFLTACSGTNDRLNAASEAKGQLEATRALPELPAYCREQTRSGVRHGDRLDTALLRTDAALHAEHRRTSACAEWYDGLREGFSRGTIPLGPK